MEELLMSVEKIAPWIADNIDKETIKKLNGRREIDFSIIGDTVFTRAVKKKLEKLGIKYFQSQFGLMLSSQPFIIDIESENGYQVYNLAKENDIDCCLKSTDCHDLSCVSEACFRIISSIVELKNMHIGIVGRGHAVLNLAKRLLDSDYTVTQCHSKTKDLDVALKSCDAIVYAAPKWQPFEMNNRFVLDVSYTIPKDCGNVHLINNIGNLNTSIVINRAVNRYLQLKIKYDRGSRDDTLFVPLNRHG